MQKKLRTKLSYKIFFVIPIALWILCFTSCSNQSSIANRYLTAEKLWTEKNYPAAVAEFDQILKDDPNSTIALQALLRASMTRSLFLNQVEEALKGFQLYLEKASSSEQAPSVEKEIGEIYYNRQKKYTASIDHYSRLLTLPQFAKEDQNLFRYRIARSYFLNHQPKVALIEYEKLLNSGIQGDLKIRTQLDLGQVWYAIADQEKNGFQNAMNGFLAAKKLLQPNPTQEPFYSEIEFGIATVLEELDQLEQAYEKFKLIQKTYPAENVVKIRILRLEDRLKKKRK